MNLMREKNNKILLPTTKTKKLSICSDVAFLIELDEDGKECEACQAVFSETNAGHLGLKSEFGKDGYVMCAGYQTVINLAENKNSKIFSWTDKNDGIFNYLVISGTEPSYCEMQETPFGANYASVSFLEGKPHTCNIDCGLERNFVLGKEKTGIDMFQAFDKNSKPEDQIVFMEGKGNCNIVKNSPFFGIGNKHDDVKLYTADGDVYQKKAGEAKYKKIGKDLDFVRNRIEKQKEKLKKYQLDKYDSNTKKFDIDKKEKEKKGILGKIIGRER